MESIADSTYWILRGRELFLLLHLLGITCFFYIAWRRIRPLLGAERDVRFDRPWLRTLRLLQYWLAQWRHPRFRYAGVLHITIFVGFLILVNRAFALLGAGISDRFSTESTGWYGIVQIYATTVVFLCMIVAASRRLILRPSRYQRSADAVFLLGLIALIMASDAVFEGSRAAYRGDLLPAGSLAWLTQQLLGTVTGPVVRQVYLGAYLVHEVAFFFLLCYRPFGSQFHVETSLLSIWCAKLDRGSIKPARWGIPEEEAASLPSLGVKKFEDFTWKHILDFYSCADCGRCAEMCPAHAVGRSIAPRSFTIKAKDYAFRRYPVWGRPNDGVPLIGGIFSEDEIWSCTTCAACEAECPLLVEYIDKIVDLRRGLIDDGRAPQSLHKPLRALESRGNPFGKPEKKRADWAAGAVKLASAPAAVETLYFVDSVTSYDDRLRSVGMAAAAVLRRIGENFGVLGSRERDSGHDVRRFGEEVLFQSLRAQNTEAIAAAGVRRIVTSDPHAFNALRHDYRGLPPVEHLTQVMARAVRSGWLRLSAAPAGVYTYHDACYLGRHNGIYDEPRDVLDSIPGLKRVEMKRARDRSFCCGGGGLALFYEAKEDERMAVRRVRMAADAGANTIVTACPFCLLNVEDAIKVAGLDGRMSVIDLTELVDRVSDPEAARPPEMATAVH